MKISSSVSIWLLGQGLRSFVEPLLPPQLSPLPPLPCEQSDITAERVTWRFGLLLFHSYRIVQLSSAHLLLGLRFAVSLSTFIFNPLHYTTLHYSTFLPTLLPTNDSNSNSNYFNTCSKYLQQQTRRCIVLRERPTATIQIDSQLLLNLSYHRSISSRVTATPFAFNFKRTKKNSIQKLFSQCIFKFNI